MVSSRSIAVFACACLLSGCADYISNTRKVRRAYEAYDTDAALKELPKAEEAGVDELLVLLDQGMILHAAGRWQDSIEVLARADKRSAELDAISVTEEAGTLLGNERSRHYRGEDFEKLLISVIQGLNYAMLGDREGALVEVRRCGERLRKMQQEEKKPWTQLAIASLLGGILYEDDQDLDAAFIDLKATLDLTPSLSLLAEPLLRLAQQLGRQQELDELKAKFPDQEPSAPLGAGEGELWVLVKAGLSPEKHEASSGRHGTPHYAHQSALVQFPVYASRGRPQAAQVAVEGKTYEAQTVTSLESVARLHLDSRVGAMIARSAVSTALKAGIAGAAGAAAKDSGVGWLVFLLLSLGTEADLRSWMSLPNEFQAVRVRVPSGKQVVTVATPGLSREYEVEVHSRGVGLLVVRRY